MPERHLGGSVSIELEMIAAGVCDMASYHATWGAGGMTHTQPAPIASVPDQHVSGVQCSVLLYVPVSSLWC